MTDAPMRPGTRYALKHTTRSTRAVVDSVDHVIDVHTLEPNGHGELELNDIGRVNLRLAEPLGADPYADNRTTGSLILIDEPSNDTVGAGLVVGAGDQPR